MPRKKSTSTTKRRQQLGFGDWYEIAKKYYEEYGDLLVPRIYEDEEGHIKILSSCRTEARVRSGLPIGVLRCAMARCRKKE